LVQALEGKDVKDLLLNVGSGGGAAAAPSGGAAAGGAGEAAAEEKAEEKEEGAYPQSYYLDPIDPLTIATEKEESDEDMGFGLFD
jgi:large subunit ribosomal protein LP1